MSATHFIEQIKYYDGQIKSLSPIPIKHLQWSLEVNDRHGIVTIAIFKIYQKPKPMIVTYDHELKAMIVE